MPGWLQAFTAHQPMTPIGQTIRGLLTGTPIGDNPVLSVLGCAGIALVGYLWGEVSVPYEEPVMTREDDERPTDDRQWLGRASFH